ncbi:MAG: MBL fold metallo-hydrolase [Candidatus Woesearchaeota archaeon]|jgi:glyoxylase-like metal-dependent hydrolase (beta-lactamase superfamily II)
MKQKLCITKYQEDIYCIEELGYSEHCNCYLLIGKEKCLLIDTGIGLINLQEALKKIIEKKELIVVLTHLHFDHIGGTHNFSNIIVNKINIENKNLGLEYFSKQDLQEEKQFNELVLQIKKNAVSGKKEFKQAKQGKIIDLGNFSVEIIFTPGHDSSSICLFEKTKKILFSGDTIYDGNLYYSFPDSDINKYIHSLKKIKDLNPKIIMGGHNSPIQKNVETIIDKKINFLTMLTKKMITNKD